MEKGVDRSSELNELKEMNTRWSGEKVALQTRLSQQEQVILALKFKLLQYEIASKSKTEEELDVIMEEHKKDVQQLHCHLATRNDVIHKQKKEIKDLQDDIQAKIETETSLLMKLDSHEKKIASLQSQLDDVNQRLKNNSPSSTSECVPTEADIVKAPLKTLPDTQKVLREHKSMCTILCNIRQKLKNNENLERCIDERSTSTDQESTCCRTPDSGGSLKSNAVRTSNLIKNVEQIRSTRLLNNNRILNYQQSVAPTLNHMYKSTGSVDSGYEQRLPSDPGERLKVIYYLGKSMTPVLKISDIELGSFTLGDFKAAVNRPGKFRYFFKCVDSDFGYVREELLFDDEVVPGHDNKVVAWLERNMSDL